MQGESITAFAIEARDADNDTLTVTVTGLPSGLSYSNGQVSGTVSERAAVKDYTATITANDGTNPDVTETFTVTVHGELLLPITVPPDSPTPNSAPVITDPGDKTYDQGEAITAFAIEVNDADNDTLTVNVTGLPSGLSYSNGQVSGTVSETAAVKDYTATITASDGTNEVSATFTVTVEASDTEGNQPPETELPGGPPTNSAPVITDPGSKTYYQGEDITAFAIEVRDVDGDTVTVTVTGLPTGLSYDATTKQVSGTVSQTAAVKDYTATIIANDGANPDVTESFTVNVRQSRRLVPHRHPDLRRRRDQPRHLNPTRRRLQSRHLHPTRHRGLDPRQRLDLPLVPRQGQRIYLHRQPGRLRGPQRILCLTRRRDQRRNLHLKPHQSL